MSRLDPDKILYKPPFDDQKEDVLALINDGWSDSKIAEHFGVTKDTIWCRRARWEYPSGTQVKADKLVDDITELWKNCYSVQEIADSLNISECVVYIKMRQHSIRTVNQLGLNVTAIPLSKLEITDDPNDDKIMLITFKRQPRYVLVPIDDYIATVGT